MPYKDKEKQLRAMREINRRYRLRKLLREKRKRTLDNLGRFLMDTYFNKLVNEGETLRTIDEYGGPAIRNKGLTGEISALHLQIHDLAKNKSKSIAHVFAFRLWQFYEFTPSIMAANLSLYNWVCAFEDVIKHPTKKNEKHEQEKWIELDPTWKKQLEDTGIERELTAVERNPIFELLKKKGEK